MLVLLGGLMTTVAIAWGAALGPQQVHWESWRWAIAWHNSATPGADVPSMKVLPLRPLWPGLVGNVLVWSFAWSIPWLAVVIRRGVRRRRGVRVRPARARRPGRGCRAMSGVRCVDAAQRTKIVTRSMNVSNVKAKTGTTTRWVTRSSISVLACSRT